MTAEMTAARAQATQDVASAVLIAAGDVMMRHGNDPHSVVIVAAGFVMALKAAGEDFPMLPVIVREMLEKDGAS